MAKAILLPHTSTKTNYIFQSRFVWGTQHISWCTPFTLCEFVDIDALSYFLGSCRSEDLAGQTQTRTPLLLPWCVSAPNVVKSNISGHMLIKGRALQGPLPFPHTWTNQTSELVKPWSTRSSGGQVQDWHGCTLLPSSPHQNLVPLIKAEWLMIEGAAASSFQFPLSPAGAVQPRRTASSLPPHLFQSQLDANASLWV